MKGNWETRRVCGGFPLRTQYSRDTLGWDRDSDIVING